MPTSLYVDTSCLLKMLWQEPETGRTESLVAAEEMVVVSDLARLEVGVQIQARRAAGLLTRRGRERLASRFDRLVATPPFELRACAQSLIEDARLQAGAARPRAHCRTLDRLHLAAMAGMGLRRLLTNDDGQAGAARALGIRVVMPR
jgi:predicted nucleic acid-binding protein